MGFDVEKTMDLAAKPQPAVAAMTLSNQPSVAMETPSSLPSLLKAWCTCHVSTTFK